MNDGGQAFPAAWGEVPPMPGMTLRDYFAASYEPTEEDVKRTTALWEREDGKYFSLADVRAHLRYKEADAMLKERERE